MLQPKGRLSTQQQSSILFSSILSIPLLIIQLSSQMSINKCQLVRQTCNWVFQQAHHTHFNQQKLAALADRFHYTPFNQFKHHNLQSSQDQVEKTLLYLFTLDCLNFCFWPLQGFEYEHLAASVKQFIQKQHALAHIREITEEKLVQEIFGGVKVPLADERARILRQMSTVVMDQFDGSLCSLLSRANHSAVQLLSILTSNFPNFQDHSLYRGHQVHFYKRPQILIGDIYAKFEGQGWGRFDDIHQLTMFPDYRVPQILNHHQVLQYSPQLQDKISNKVEIGSGSEEEIEIRAASVVIVEKIREYLLVRGKKVNSIEVDWFLWEEGEKNLKEIVDHHRVLTIYY